MTSTFASAFMTDLESVRDGKWFDFSSIVNGLKVKIALATTMNIEYVKACAKYHTPHAKEIDEMDTASKEAFDLLRALNAGIYADAIVKDWKGVTYGMPEKSIEFSRENVEKILVDERYAKFYSLIEEKAKDESLFNVSEGAKKTKKR